MYGCDRMNDSSVSIIFLDVYSMLWKEKWWMKEHTRYNKRIQILRNSNFCKINRLNKKCFSCLCFRQSSSTYLYPWPTVAGFFSGNLVKSLNKIFNSPIAFAGFKPWMKRHFHLIQLRKFSFWSYFRTNFSTIQNCMATIDWKRITEIFKTFLSIFITRINDPSK